MCHRLKERSIVDRVFVFYSSQASDMLSQRDMKQENELLTQLFAEGSTQGKQMRVLLYTYLMSLFTDMLGVHYQHR